jgi:heat shock protein HtpX
MSEEVAFHIPSELPDAQLDELLDQVRRYHLLLHPEWFRDVRRGTVGGKHAVAFTVLLADRKWRMAAKLWAEKGLEVRATPDEGTPPQAAEWLQADLTAVVKTIERDLGQANITLIWVKGETIAPEEMPSALKRITGRLFSSALILLNILFFAFNIVLFLLIGFTAVIFILVIQLVLILFADRIFALTGKWRITERNPQAYLLQIKVTGDVLEAIRQKKVDLVKLKHDVFESSFARGREPTCPEIRDTLLKYGIFCSPENITTKVVNVYELVKRATGLFGVPMPRIVISNSLVPNAAASGATPRRGVLLLTGGILVQLNEQELLSVVGHEIGHLKGRDPLLLFALVSGEFILRLTVLLPLFLAIPLLYLVVAMFLIFFIAKFFEARADLLSAMVIGQPKVMAESLRKIGRERLQVEKASPINSWLRLDTHPPLYFRIERLEMLPSPLEIKHPLIQSAKDVVRGFRSAL